MNNKITCHLCNLKKNVKSSHSSAPLRKISNFKLQIKSDKKYFGKISVYKCGKCKLIFSHPMPSSKAMSYYYENIYRNDNRPPYWLNKKNTSINNSYINDKNLNLLLYLTTILKVKNLQKVLDFGSGDGDFCYALKKVFKSLKLFSIENSKECIPILKKRNYKIYKTLDRIFEKFDLIVSLSTLDHLNNLKIFNSFYKLLEKDGYLFFEVMNCENRYWKGRPYDSERLLFFTEESIRNMCKILNFEIVDLSFSSYPIGHNHKYSKESQEKYYKIISNNFNFEKIKYILKKIIPQNFLNLINNFKSIKNIYSENRVYLYTNNTGDNSYIRCILKKK